MKASSAENGSSSSSTCGRGTSARAMATRCAWPPDSSRGQTSALSVRPTRSSARATRSRRSAVGQPLQAEADIVGDPQPRQQARLLEDDADLLVRRGDDRRRRARPCLGSACRARKSPAAGGLAAAGAADDDENFARRDLESRRRRARARRWDRSCRRDRARASIWSQVRAKRSSQRRNGADTRQDQPVGGLAENGEGDDRGDDLRRLAELLAVDQQKAETGRGAQEFGRDHEHPAEPEPGAQRDHIGRHHRRQQDAPHHGEAGEAEHAADLDDLAVDRHHRAHDAEIDRKEYADRDQSDLGGLEDAEPQDEQRHPGDRRNRAQRLQRRIDQAMRQRGITGDRAQRSCRRRRRRQSRPQPAHSVASAWCCSSPVAARSTKVFQITDGGGTSRPFDNPMRTAISQNSASATGSSKPSAGRKTRASRGFDAACEVPLVRRSPSWRQET